MRRFPGFLVVSFFFAASLFLGAGAAQAFCVLNDASESLDMFAGECSDCLRVTLKPKETACCPADEARCNNKLVTFKRSRDKDSLAWSDCAMPVPPSGWVLLEEADPDADTPQTPQSLGCRVMNAKGKMISDKVVSPSHTCPNPAFTPFTC